MANRASLQMDKAEPEDQNLLWDKQECRPNPSVDCFNYVADPGLLQVQIENGTKLDTNPQDAATQPV